MLKRVHKYRQKHVANNRDSNSNSISRLPMFDIVPGDSSHSYQIEIGRDAEPIIREGPKHLFFSK